MTPPAEPQKDVIIGAICQVYREAKAVATEGERTMSTDELTGVQALERKHPGLPLAPGKGVYELVVGKQGKKEYPHLDKKNPMTREETHTWKRMSRYDRY